MKLIIRPLVVLALALGLSLTGAPARAAAPLNVSGHVTDSVTGLPIKDVCVTVGPPIRCWGGFGTNPGLHTDAAGFYFIDFDAVAASPGSQWDMYFLKTGVYDMKYSGKFVVSGPTIIDIQMTKSPLPPGQCQATTAPTQITYLPNITRTLGGPLGWDTPFYVQNAGSAATDVEASFYAFDTGALIACHRTAALAAGKSLLEDPNAAGDLPDNRQFSVVVRSYGAATFATVNQTQSVGGKLQALSYSGFAAGATKVFVPNVTRKFFGFDVPLIIQNVGSSSATITATFVSNDGSLTVPFNRVIAPGLSAVIDPDSDDLTLGAPGLRDGTQYAVTVTSSQPIAVVANAHNEAIGPLAYSHNGLAAGATTVYGPWATKSAALFSNVVVQNLGPTATTATLMFTPISGAAAQTFTTASIPAGGGFAFDVRYANGIAIQSAALCGSVASATCLGDGDYALTVTAAQPIAAVVLPNSNTLLDAYVGLASPTAKALLPVVERNFGGWNSTLWLQSTSATTATLNFNPIGAGAAVPVTISLTAGLTKKVDAATIAGLANGQQYSVVITADGTIAVVVQESNLAPGDGLMVHTGFAQLR